MTQSATGSPTYEIRALMRQGHIAAVEIVTHGVVDLKRLVLGKPCEQVPDLLARVLAVCSSAHRAAAAGAIAMAVGHRSDEDVRRFCAKAVLSERLLNGLWRLFIDWPRALGWQAQPALVAAAKRLLMSERRFEFALVGLREIVVAAESSNLMLAMTKAVHLSDAGRDAVLADRIAEAARDPALTLAGLAALEQDEVAKPEWAGDGGVVRTSRGLLIHTAAIVSGRITDYAVISPTDRIMAPGGAVETALVGLSGSDVEACARVRVALLDPCAATEVRFTEVAHA